MTHNGKTHCGKQIHVGPASKKCLCEVPWNSFFLRGHIAKNHFATHNRETSMVEEAPRRKCRCEAQKDEFFWWNPIAKGTPWEAKQQRIPFWYTLVQFFCWDPIMKNTFPKHSSTEFLCVTQEYKVALCVPLIKNPFVRHNSFVGPTNTNSLYEPH